MPLPPSITQPLAPLNPSAHQPSPMLRCGTPLMPAFMPLVPLASSGLRGVLSQTSQPWDEEMRDVQIVVVDECDAAAINRIDCVPIDLLQVMFAGIVGRMRLAGEDDLHVPSGRRQQPDEPVGIPEDQLRPLVAGEPAREADGQRSRIEQRPRGDDAAALTFSWAHRSRARWRMNVKRKPLQRSAGRVHIASSGMSSTRFQKSASSWRSRQSAPR